MFEPHFETCWRLLFRLMDDMKETVRNASASLARALGGTTVKLCSPEEGEVVGAEKLVQRKAAVGLVLPLLLEEGLGSRADIVRAFSVQNIAKLCEVGGSLLEPHVR